MADNIVRYPVLCVDDEVYLLDLCRLFLERTGEFKVTTVLSADEALEKISDMFFDAIVSDYEMPGMNGVELLKAIRRQDKRIPFVIFTGRGREEVVMDALNNGADFYLQKGGDPKAQFAELASKIRHAIHQKKAESTLELERKQLLSIFDSLEQMVYVTDPDSYEILYVNKYFQNLLKHDVIGKKCYNEFMKKDVPCDFCTNRIIKEKNPEAYSWEIYNPVFERYYSIIDRIIRWPDGRDVRLEVATDITEVKKAMFDLNAAYEEIASSEDELKHQYNELIQSQEELKESEERYRSVIENTQDVMYRSDNDGNLIMASPSALKIFGFDSMNEIIGKNIANCFYKNPADRNKFLEVLKTEGSVYNYETKLQKKDGTPVYVSTSSHYYYDKDGNIAGIEGIIRDITSLKQTSTALRESEQLYRVLVEHTQDGVFIIQNEILVFCNEAFAHILGYKRKEIIGIKISNIIAPEERDEVIWKYRRRIKREIVPDFYEFKMLHKDQKTRVLVQVSAGQGEFLGKPASIGTIRSVVAEKTTIEETLRKSRSMLNAILQESPIPQFVIDTNHLVMYWNHALEKYSGISAEDMVGTSYHWKAFYSEERPCLVDLMLDNDSKGIQKWYGEKVERSKLIDNAYSMSGFFPGVGKTGTWLYFTGALLMDSEGIVWGALETLEDISDQKMNEEGLMQANKKLNLLSDITRHDILNSLTVLSGSVDLIRDEITDEELSLYIGKAETALDTIRRQITFTRDYQNLGINAPIWQDLSGVIHEAALHYIPAEIEVIYGEKNLEVFADTMFGRVFSNLIDNSKRHGEYVTRISFDVEMRDIQAVIIYTDNGIGIPDDMKDRIFDRGVGLHTGYGLFLVREILSITGISIYERGENGKGVRFEIVIPPGYFRLIV